MTGREKGQRTREGKQLMHACSGYLSRRCGTRVDCGWVDDHVHLAVPQRVYESLFAERFGQLIRQRLQLRLMVFNEYEERIVAWIT